MRLTSSAPVAGADVICIVRLSGDVAAAIVEQPLNEKKEKKVAV